MSSMYMVAIHRPRLCVYVYKYVPVSTRCRSTYVIHVHVCPLSTWSLYTSIIIVSSIVMYVQTCELIFVFICLLEERVLRFNFV